MANISFVYLRTPYHTERIFPVKKLIKKYFTNVWNVPNVLTMLRMLLIPVFVALYAAGHDKLALLTFIVASLTDLLDGYIARKYHLITDFGKLMDPLADKLMVCTALICQGARGIIPWWAIILVMAKELLLVIGGYVMLKNNVVVYSNMLGKTAMCAFVAALVLSFFHAEFAAWGFPLDSIVLYIAVALTLLALLDYLRAGLKTLNDKKKDGWGEVS